MNGASPSGFPRWEFEAWLRQLEPERLEAELRAVQARLGTPAEGRTDFDCAQALAHRLNNLLTVNILRRNVALLDASAPRGAAPK